MEFRVRHALAFIKQTGVTEFSVAGNSMGGYLAGRIALAEQERTKRLVIVASGGLSPPASPEVEVISREHGRELREFTPSLENMCQLTRGTIYNHEVITEELVQHRYEMSTGKNYEAQKGRDSAPPLRPVNEELRTLRVKTLVVWGANDRGSPVEKGVLLFRARSSTSSTGARTGQCGTRPLGSIPSCGTFWLPSSAVVVAR